MRDEETQIGHGLRAHRPDEAEVVAELWDLRWAGDSERPRKGGDWRWGGGRGGGRAVRGRGEKAVQRKGSETSRKGSDRFMMMV